MALTIDATSDSTISINDYLDYMNREIAVDDIDQIVDTAPVFASLLRDPTIVAAAINKELLNWREFQQENKYTAQTFLLGITDKFALRANVWMPPSEDPKIRAWEEKLYYYNVPHDHNFSFMTGGYCGSGYETIIYEYDYESILGLENETVPLRFLERTTLPKGKIMYYRASVDIHSQMPAREFSISLNLLPVNPADRLKTQYIFDPANQRIKEPVRNSTSSQSTVCCAAVYVGNNRTSELLDDLSISHPNARFRRNALRALSRREPSRVEDFLQRAARDNDPLVRGLLTEGQM